MTSDIHIYYFQENKDQREYAAALWERIRREFPELRIYRLWDKPIGPHPVAMFEVNVFTPHQFGAFVAWLAIWRGPLSALVHPNTTEADVDSVDRALRNHTEQAIWMGERIPLDLSLFSRLRKIRAEQRAEAPTAVSTTGTGTGTEAQSVAS